jgi:hypothetical protein
MHTLTRTRRTMAYGVAVAVAVLGFSGIASATSSTRGAAAAAKTGTCTLKTVDIAPTAVNGEDFGMLKCPAPFGKGVQHNTGRLTPTSATTGTLKGSSRLYFETGSVRATFSLKYELSGGKLILAGTAKVVGGTGAFKGITGSVKLTGSSLDGGTHATITEKIKVKLP